jgi:hypothetical protein
MNQQTARDSDAFRAAGYCGAKHPASHARCTRSPGHAGQHVDYYTGRQSVTDAEGLRWGK